MPVGPDVGWIELNVVVAAEKGDLNLRRLEFEGPHVHLELFDARPVDLPQRSHGVNPGVAMRMLQRALAHTLTQQRQQPYRLTETRLCGFSTSATAVLLLPRGGRLPHGGEP